MKMKMKTKKALWQFLRKHVRGFNTRWVDYHCGYARCDYLESVIEGIEEAMSEGKTHWELQDFEAKNSTPQIFDFELSDFKQIKKGEN